MKILLNILLFFPLVLTETEFRIVPSIQTSQQLQSSRFEASVPHTIYGPPPVNKVETLDIQRLPDNSVAQFRLRAPQITLRSQNNLRKQNQAIPATTYGVPQENLDFEQNPAGIPPPRRQYLPIFEAEKFNKNFQSTNSVEGVDVRSENRPNIPNIPVIPGLHASDEQEEEGNVEATTTEQYPTTEESFTQRLPKENPNFNFNNVNDKFPQPQDGIDTNTEYPYVYFPPSTTTVKPVLRRRRPKPITTTTTTESPIEEGDEDTAESDDDQSLANRPNVAIANAFAGLYLPQQPQPETSGSRILPTNLQPQTPKPQEAAADCNQQYATGYQLQNLVTYQQPIAYQQPLIYQQPLVYQKLVALQQPQLYQPTVYSQFNAWRK